VEHRKFVSFGLLGVVALVVAVTAFSLSQNLTYYLFPDEAIEQRAEFPDGKRFRLAGMVAPGSLSRDGDNVVFVVTDGGSSIDVVLTGTPPALFDDGVPVLIEGAWDGPIFLGDTAVIRHSENYEIPEEGGAYPDS
jgi:cytochrome c-type biogenesis protein CcmE